MIVSSSVVGAVTLGSAFTLVHISSESQPLVQGAQPKPTINSSSLRHLSQSEIAETLFFLLIGGSAGAVGSIVSILLRIKDIVVVDDDHRVDPILPIFLGLFKPVIGGAFGIFTITLLSTEIISIGTISDSGARECLFFSIAFAVGFSERLAKDVIKKTEDMILSSAPSTQAAILSAHTVATQLAEPSSTKLTEAFSSINDQGGLKEKNSTEASTQATPEMDSPLEDANPSLKERNQEDNLIQANNCAHQTG